MEEVKNTRIKELEKELAMLKQIYEDKLKEKAKRKEEEQERNLTEEIEKFKTQIQLENEEVNVEEINDTDLDTIEDHYSKTSETYTELMKNMQLEINTGDIDTNPLHRENKLFITMNIII